MRGTILGFDMLEGTGVITDTAGMRVKFGRSDWKSPGEPVAGRQVDYDMAEDRAIDIFAIPGASNPLDFGGQDPTKQTMTFGIISLVCAVLSFMIGPFGLFTLVAAVYFGLKGKNLGGDLADKTGYYLSIAGLIVSAIALVIVLFAVTACIGILGLAGSMRHF